MIEKLFDELKEFTYEAYFNLLNYLQTRYSIITFNEISVTNNPYVILRHDIDASLKQALNMAILENKLNIKSTYFVLFSHKYYNLFEKESMNELREISKLGHEIGLHYNLEIYDSYNMKYFDILQSEISLLESFLNKKVNSISMHNISMTKKEDLFRSSNKFINAYNTELYDLYVSDSSRAWDIEDLTRLLKCNYKKVQLLIHPFLWTKKYKKRENILECYFRNIRDKDKKYKDRWIKIWNNSLKVRKYEEHIKYL